MPRRPDCSSLRAAYAELLDLKKRCKLALEEAKKTGNVDPATKLVMLCKQKAKELGQQVNPFWEKVDVSYKMPSTEELEKRFDPVSTVFDERSWEPIDDCKSVSREPRKIRFEFLKMDHDLLTEEVLAEMKKQGLRPALLEELLCFAIHYPGSSEENCVALGSFTLNNDVDYLAVLSSVLDSGRQALIKIPWLGIFEQGWSRGDVFLCVRE